ncbi:helicase-related protein [Pseudobacillus sp. 179-B 2D1 NHS]|uniref:helicase-related protein n=1 Tax=Pseudobacillus sp. 179-B 2D1 NHS TaxID=3374292 RepID=UPI0038793358
MTTLQTVDIFKKKEETTDHPKMVEVFVDGKTYQNAFCYSMIVADDPGTRKTMLSCIIAGADSTMQSMKAAIDLGAFGFSFGYGVKGQNGYHFNEEVKLHTEKGKYNYFPMSLENRKAYAIVHDDVLDGKYLMSFNPSPAQDIRTLLGGHNYGLPTLEEWAEILTEEMKKREHLKEVPMYYDVGIFPDGFHFFEVNMTEEEGDAMLSELIQNGRLAFPEEGSGSKVEEITDLTSYMTEYSEDMLKKISSFLKPTHNPVTDQSYSYFNEYNMQLFPVQAHVATGIAKRLQKQKSVILQGEMSTGKSKMMTAIADAYAKMKGKKGFHAILMVPPSLTDKWSKEEIYDLLPSPRAKVIHVASTAQLIEFHQSWIREGKPKPEVPTFFVVSFTTMRSDSAIEPAVSFSYLKTKKQKTLERRPYRFGYYCADCGLPHHVIESESTKINEEGEEEKEVQKKIMEESEFGTSRRLHNNKMPANAFCSECGSSLWKKAAPTRYQSFKEWTEYEKQLISAIETKDPFAVRRVKETQPDIKKKVGSPRRIATVEYIRRKMKHFFDVAIIDEVHELKGGATAQGNALGSLAAASKRVIAGTGTLFGGKASDIYFLLWRLFPYEMVKAGYKYSDINRWNYEYGNVEKVTYSSDGSSSTEYTNKQSRGGTRTKSTEKVLPGISPFVFGRFLLQNTVLVRLLDVWPDPVELVNVPTIMVDMDERSKQLYQDMKDTFEHEINNNKGKDKKFNNLWLLYTDTGIAYPDNPHRFPSVNAKGTDGLRHHIWSPVEYMEEDYVTPKEKKLIEIIKGEIEEGRPSIVYVRDTGTSVTDRDIQPRLQKVIEENVDGAKVAILRNNTTKTDQRSHWLKKKVEKEGHNVIIVSMELVKVGLDLLATPTIIFYQFSWSMFTMGQASKRAWRIGQTEECRLFYLAYANTFQETMALLIAQKNKASSAINGDVSSDGLNAMLGDEGDLQTMLIKSIQNNEKLEGSSEEWVSATTDRARELLSGIGKKKKSATLFDQLIAWAKTKSMDHITISTIEEKKDVIISRLQQQQIVGFHIDQNVLSIDEFIAFGFGSVTDGDLIQHLLGDKPKTTGFQDVEIRIIAEPIKKRKGKNAKSVTQSEDAQLALDLFA